MHQRANRDSPVFAELSSLLRKTSGLADVLRAALKIGRLKEHEPTPAEMQRLLAAAERNLADSPVADVSDETRFDAAYRAVMQCALAAMMASGYRPSTSEPGHHQTLIQSLPLTLGAPGMVSEATAQAASLLKTLRAWLKAQHPDFLK